MSKRSRDRWEKASPRAYLTIYVVSLRPRPLIFQPQNLISSSVSPTALKLSIWWNSHKQFVRYRASKLIVNDHWCAEECMHAGTAQQQNYI